MAIERQPPHVYTAKALRRPQIAVEVVVFVIHEGRLGIVLEPFERFSSTSRWGLPAAVIEDQPSLESALDELTDPLLGGEVAKKFQVRTFDRLSDSRGRLIEIAWLAVAPIDAVELSLCTIGYWTPAVGDAFGLTDATGEKLEMLDEQTESVLAAIDRLRELLETDSVAFDLLPEEFTLRDLHTVHEAVLGTSLNYDSFRRRMLTSGLIEPSGRVEQNVTHRPAELYRARPGR